MNRLQTRTENHLNFPIGQPIVILEIIGQPQTEQRFLSLLSKFNLSQFSQMDFLCVRSFSVIAISIIPVAPNLLGLDKEPQEIRYPKSATENFRL